MSFTVLVCGGRNYNKSLRIIAILRAVHTVRPIDRIIEGGAHGADMHACLWAKTNNIPTSTFKAEWDKHGYAAGPIRNKRMLVEGKPDLVLAFPGGAGTANMVRQAIDHGVRTFDIPDEDSFPEGPTVLQGVINELSKLGISR